MNDLLTEISFNLHFNIYFLLFCVHEWLSVCMYVCTPQVCLVPGRRGPSRGHWIPWKWSNRWLWVDIIYKYYSLLTHLISPIHPPFSKNCVSIPVFKISARKCILPYLEEHAACSGSQSSIPALQKSTDSFFFFFNLCHALSYSSDHQKDSVWFNSL